MAIAPKKKWTVEEYLEFERSNEGRHEFLDGEVFAMAGATSRHGLICGSIYSSLFTQTEDRNCFVYQSDMRVKVSASGLYTYPDIVALRGEQQFEDAVQDSVLNPSTIIEVLSPSTERYDRGKKFQYYQSVKSLQEYLLVSQDSPRLELYSRHTGGRWIYSDFVEMNASLELPSIGCTLSLANVYRKVSFGSDVAE